MALFYPLKTLVTDSGGGGVFDADFGFVAGMFRGNPPNNGVYGVHGIYAVNEIEKIDEEVIFGGALVGLFGHLILDSLSRMWYILKNRDDKRKIVFLLIRKEHSWFYPFFDLLDIPRERIIILRKPTLYKKVIIPDESVHSWYNYTKEYLVPYDYIRSKIKNSDIKKIYLTRSKFDETLRKTSVRYLCNERYFEKYFENKGYKIIEPEEYSVEDQISMISSAENIVSTLGTLSHFALFCKPGVKFTMLTRVDNATLYPQCLINEAKQIDWYIVDVSMNFLPIQNRTNGVCLLGETKYWRQFVKEKYGEIINTNSWKEASNDYVEKWCRFYSIDSAISLVTSVFERTYELTKRNIMPPEELLRSLLQRINFLESQLQSTNRQLTSKKKKKK